MIMSRGILDELRELEVEEMAVDADTSVRERLPRRRGSLAVERFAGIIHLYVMAELGYGLPDLDEVLRTVVREPNPHRDRLRTQVEVGEFRPALA